jgi:hypothetical protein
VTEPDDHCGNERETVLALVRDQDAEVLDLITRPRLHLGVRLHAAAILAEGLSW